MAGMIRRGESYDESVHREDISEVRMNAFVMPVPGAGLLAAGRFAPARPAGQLRR